MSYVNASRHLPVGADSAPSSPGMFAGIVIGVLAALAIQALYVYARDHS